MKRKFKKYFRSVLDPDEFSMLEEYFGNRKNDKEISGLMKTIWDEKMDDIPEDPKSNPALFDRITEAIQAGDRRRTQRKLKAYAWGFRAAAVLVLALITGSIFYLQKKQKLLAQQWHTITTPFGAKSKITLPDSTFIWINAGSTIRYSNEFGIRNREVHLSGEAFFDVAKDLNLQFSVKTSELTIKSYGTAFNVKSYPEEGTIETTLIEGSIGVTRSSYENKKKDEVLLEPNQRVVFYRKTKTLESSLNEHKTEEISVYSSPEPDVQKTTYLISKGIDTEEYTAWKDGTLFISGETLAELAVKLERKYDVKIHFESEALLRLRFTGSLENETVEQVIHAIGIAAQIGYEIEDRDIWFKEQLK